MKHFGYRDTNPNYKQSRYPLTAYIYLGEDHIFYYWLTSDAKIWKKKQLAKKPEMLFWGSWSTFINTMKEGRWPTFAPTDRCKDLIEQYLKILGENKC